MAEEKKRNWFVRHKVWTVILGIIILLVIVGVAGGGKTSQQGTTAKTEQPQTATVVDYKAFGDEFDANQPAAEKKWGGKLIQFSAPISNITDNGLSFQNAGSKEFSLTQISCTVKDKNQLLSLQNGQQVTVKGVVGSQTIGVIGVDQCEVVQ